MIPKELEKFLPLKILKVESEELFQLSGAFWRFKTTGAWRISFPDRMGLGSYDDEANSIIQKIIDMEITKIECANDTLKIDPVFHFFNGQRLEIFSTSSTIPWELEIKGLGRYCAWVKQENT